MTHTAHAWLPSLALAALLAACSGSTGPQGQAGATGPTGPAGPPGPGAGIAALDVSTATLITGKITSVTINSPPVVKFSLADQDGVPLKGLPAADISWVIAKLTPGQNGAASTWQSYIYQTVTPSGCPTGASGCLAAAATQATTESGATGTLVDNGDGTYQYTFKKDITTDPNVTYDATLTHRVAFEIRGLAQANNGAYTFQPSTGATTGIFTREIIELATCNGCHTQLMLHGGARVETQYCVMCHNPSTTDPYSGNPLDFKQMIHKIHQGNSLASIQTPPGLALTGSATLHTGSNTTPTLNQGYWIVGFRNSLSNFNTVLFPQDTRNCTTCHNQNLPAATEAANYAGVPTVEACGACHDNINFTTGAGHSPANLPAD
ncbi:MAG TPA: OmcA/MtrC family decaheme c-type cytochrome, partial [Steroidobacteraceae bacterium]|nr:OmcA/MtrC family decaheme c-type cytochrome [Steroidobacteraceae bacterium]